MFLPLRLLQEWLLFSVFAFVGANLSQLPICPLAGKMKMSGSKWLLKESK